MDDKKKKILRTACIAAAVILLVFLGYPLLVHAVNYPAIIKEKNHVAEKIKSFGGEVYSSKIILSTEMTYEGSYRILYGTEYVIIFKSEKSIEEINGILRWQLTCPLEEAGQWGFGEEQIKSAKLPDDKEGYYATYCPYKTTISETAGTKLHTYIYADAENRMDIKEELEYYK